MATKRLIDADHLHRYVLYEYMRATMKEKDNYDFAHFAGIVVAMVEELLKGMPTVDAVEVVRCKDCQNCSNIIMPITGTRRWFCDRQKGSPEVTPVDYCSYGERKEND